MGVPRPVFRTTPDVTIPCRTCPYCKLNTAIMFAANGRGGALLRCVSKDCGRMHDGPFPGADRPEVRGRCEDCGQSLLYAGRGRPRTRCERCKAGFSRAYDYPQPTH